MAARPAAAALALLLVLVLGCTDRPDRGAVDDALAGATGTDGAGTVELVRVGGVEGLSAPQADAAVDALDPARLDALAAALDGGSLDEAEADDFFAALAAEGQADATVEAVAAWVAGGFLALVDAGRLEAGADGVVDSRVEVLAALQRGFTGEGTDPGGAAQADRVVDAARTALVDRLVADGELEEPPPGGASGSLAGRLGQDPLDQLGEQAARRAGDG